MVDSYWGLCTCGQPGNRWINVRGVHFVLCTVCKTGWCVGANLVSSWRDETEELWAANEKMLKEEYTRIEPLTDLRRVFGVDERTDLDANG